jgi:hypothetical protein
MDNKIKEHQFKASDLRKFADGGVIASNIIMQLGGFSRLQIMLGAYNFVDLKNGLSFKIKNPKANFIKIILNGKDLYDIEIGRIRGTTYKVVYSQEDVYAVDLRKIIEKHTGMYMAFKDGGDIVLEDAYNRDEYTDEETLIYAQSYKLANGGITAMEVLEAREFVGEKDWIKMKPKERLAATRYLIRTGKIGYYAYANGGTTKARPSHKSSYTKKYKVKYLIGYSDEEEGLKYYEEFYYADSKDVAALEVFDHLQRQGYTHIEILSIALMADKGMEVQSDEQLMQKYRKLKGNYVPDWFRDMPTRYKVEIIEEIEEGYEDEKPEGDEFANGGSIQSKRERVIDYYINNEDDETLNDFGVPERALENRDKYYKEIFEKISDQFEDEEIYYKFRELNLDEASEEPEDYAHGGKIEVKIKERLSKSFELPLQMAIYVPSTKDKNVVISKDELAYRVKVVEKYLATLFGGFNSAKVDGGFQSVDKGVINEDAVRVVAFANPEGFEPKFEKLVNKVKEWCRLWSQESIGLEFENDLFYIEQDSKFAKGGKVKEKIFIEYLNKKKGYVMDRKYFNSYEEAERWARDNFDKFDKDYIKYEYEAMAKGGKVKDPHPDYPDFVSMQYADGGYDTDDKVNVYVLLKPSQYYYDSDNTTNKKYWFKLNGNPVSREVAKEMADKYLQKYNLPLSDRKIGYVRRYGRYEDGGMVSLNKHYKSLGKKDDLVGLKVYDKNNDEFVYIKNVDSGIFAGKNKNDDLGHNYSMSDLMIEKMEYGGKMDKKPAKFKDKVKAISKSLEGKKVPKRVRKDYGATYDKKESIDAAKRIAGSMAKKERKRYEI